MKFITLALQIFLSVQISYQYTNFHFKYTGYYVPHPEKAHRGGEDAGFASSMIISISDGVGGWANHGIDPSGYSRGNIYKIY